MKDNFFLKGAALEQHSLELNEAMESYWAERRASGNLPKAELALEDFASMLGDQYPEWQMRTECVTAFVENKGCSLADALARFGLSEEQYLFNLEKLKHGEGTDF